MRHFVIFLILYPCFLYSQTDFKAKIDSLKFVKEIPYSCEITQNEFKPNSVDTFIYNIGCGDKLFWDIVKMKDAVILLLIEQLDNTEETTASFPLQGGQCNVADISYIALQEIIHGIPTARLLNINPRDFDCGYCYYYMTLKNIENRRKFKKAVTEWYLDHKEKLVWIANNNYGTCECNGKHPSGGHYMINE